MALEKIFYAVPFAHDAKITVRLDDGSNLFISFVAVRIISNEDDTYRTRYTDSSYRHWDGDWLKDNVVGGYNNDYVVEYAVPFKHNAVIRINNGTVYRFTTIRIYLDTDADNYNIRYTDADNNKYSWAGMMTLAKMSEQ